jgi:integral membrane protein (TIGR00529 family)
MIALLKLTFVFAGIVILLSRKWNLGAVLLLASVVVGILFAHPLFKIGQDIIFTVVDLPALRLALEAENITDALAILRTADVLSLRMALVVVLIVILGELLHQTASTQRMVEALQELISNGHIVITVLPALIGFLPMTGGAMFSAPMVDEVGNRLGASKERKTFINYWFRHIWEPTYPLYPSMLLAAELLGLTTTQLAKAAWPLTAAAALGGLIFGLSGLPRRGKDDPLSNHHSPNLHTLALLAKSIWPILLVITLATIIPVGERFSLILSLLVTLALMMVVRRIPLRDMRTILREHIPWQTVIVIFGALIFRRVLENSGAVLAISDELTDLHIPLAVVTFGVPFIAGLLTGLMTASYSIGFPVVLPLVLVDGGNIAPTWTAWIMAGGIIGSMLSPVHLCLGLTRVYFKAEWGPVYRLLVPAAFLMIATAAGMFLLA